MLLLDMAYRLLREFRQASTRLDTPPFSNRRHPGSDIAREAVKSLSPRSRAMSWQGFVDSVLRADHPQPVRCDESARFCVSSSLIHRCVPVLRSSTGPYRKLGIRL